MAHLREFPGELSKYEATRCKFAYRATLSITLEEKSTIEEVFWVYVQRLKNQVQQMDFSYLSAKEVHDIRTEIRVIRALIWLMTDKEEDTQLVKDLQIQDIQLKKLFKLFEYSRKLSVLRKSFKKTGVNDKYSQVVTKLIKKENHHIASKVKKRLKKEAILFGDGKDIKLEANIPMEMKLGVFKERLSKASINDIDTLHALRICNKKFKYLIEDGVLKLSEPKDLKILTGIHEQIGKLNDITENRLLLESLRTNNKLLLQKEESQTLESYYKVKEEKHIKKNQIPFVLHEEEMVLNVGLLFV